MVSCAPLVPVPSVAASLWPCHGAAPRCQLPGDTGTRDGHHGGVTLARPGPKEVAAPCTAPALSSLRPGRGFKRLRSSENSILPNDAAVHLMTVIKSPPRTAPLLLKGRRERGEGNETAAEAGSCAALTPPEAPSGLSGDATGFVTPLSATSQSRLAGAPGAPVLAPTRRGRHVRHPGAPPSSLSLPPAAAGPFKPCQRCRLLRAPRPGCGPRAREVGGGSEPCQQRSPGPAPPPISRSRSPCRRVGRQRD